MPRQSVAGSRYPADNPTDRPTAITTPRLLRVHEAASLLGISRSHAYNLIQRGVLPHLRMGASVRVPARALEEWQRRQTVGG